MKYEITDADISLTIGTMAGGAILGVSLGGDPGAVVGGIIGVLAGEWTSMSKHKNDGKKSGRAVGGTPRR